MDASCTQLSPHFAFSAALTPSQTVCLDVSRYRYTSTMLHSSLALLAAVAIALVSLATANPTTTTSYPVLTHDYINDRTPYEQVRGRPYKVDFNGRAVTINDANVLLQSGSIHYPRSTPEMWPHLMNHTRAAGLNTVQGQSHHTRY